MSEAASIHVYDDFKCNLQEICREVGAYYGSMEILMRESMFVARVKTRNVDMTVCQSFAEEPTTLRSLVRAAEYELARDNYAEVADLLTAIRLRLEDE